MEFVAVPDTMLVEVLMLLDAQKIENTFYCSSESGVTEESLEAISIVTSAWVEAEYFPQLSNVITLVGVKCTDLTTDTGPTHTRFPASPVAGGVAQPSVPSATAWAVKRLTSARGRSGRGRVFVPAIPETSRVGINGLNISFANAIVTAMEELTLGFASEGFVNAVVTRVHDGLPRAVGIAQPITSWGYTDLILDSQRRRGPGRGS